MADLIASLAAQDRRRPVELLRQHHPRQLVRQRQLAQREAPLRALQERGRDAGRTPEQERGPLRRPLLALAQPRREALGVERAPAAVEADQRPALQVRLHAPALALLHLLDGALLERLLAHLEHLEAQHAAQPPLVLGGRLRQRPAGAADRDDAQHGPATTYWSSSSSSTSTSTSSSASRFSVSGSSRIRSRADHFE